MDEKIQDNSIFEAELSDRYKEELLSDIPDIWDRINSRLDNLATAPSANDPVADSTADINSNISSAYLPVNEDAAPVIRYNKAAAKVSHGRNLSSALAHFVPIAAAVVVLCICVPVFIKLQHSKNSECATAPAYEITTDSVTLGDDNSSYYHSTETKTANDTYSAGETYEDAFAEQAEESVDYADEESNERDAVESITTENSTNNSYIKIYVVPDTDFSKIEKLISDYGLELESDDSEPNVYNLFPDHSMDIKELTEICDEIRKYDYIVQATPVDQ